MTVTLRMRLKGLLVGFILGAAIIAVIILAPRNPTSEEATIIYLAGVVFGLLLGLIQHLIMRNETYPIPDTPGKTASLIRWICLPAVIIIGVILALLFAGGFTVTPDNTLIIKTYLMSSISKIKSSKFRASLFKKTFMKYRSCIFHNFWIFRFRNFNKFSYC